MSGAEAAPAARGGGAVKRYLVPFVVAFAAFIGAFLLLDLVVMSLQGLSLFFSY